MIGVRGTLYVRCDKCQRMMKIEIDSGLLYGELIAERSMGEEYYYSYEEEFECCCGNVISIRLDADEYPVGDAIECEPPRICGGEATNMPRVTGYFSDEAYRYGESQHRWSEDGYRRIIEDMSPRQFEIFVGAVLHSRGYENVVVTGRTRDGSHDFRAEYNAPGMQTTIIGECKHWKNKVGEDIIRRIHDVQYDRHANNAIVVTSSTFTRDAIRRAEYYGIELWDIDVLVELGEDVLRNY